jgi:PHP family Zn ribbon phosphoesterase
MKAITQNKIGTITITESAIRSSITNYAQFNSNYKLSNLEINEIENNRFVFTLILSTTKYKKMIDDIDALVSYIQKQVEKNLQLFGSTIIVKISN